MKTFCKGHGIVLLVLQEKAQQLFNPRNIYSIFSILFRILFKKTFVTFLIGLLRNH